MGALSADALLAWKACEAMGDAVALVQGGGREGASCAWVGERFAQLLDLSEETTVAELLQRLPQLQAGVQALVAVKPAGVVLAACLMVSSMQAFAPVYWR